MGLGSKKRGANGGISPKGDLERSCARLRAENAALIEALKINESRTNSIEGELAVSEARLKALASYLLQIREDESKKIAREMHDELGQALTGIDMGLRLLLRNGDEVSARKEGRIRALIDQSAGAIKTLQRISSELRPAVLDRLGLTAALAWLTQNYNEEGTFKMRTDIAIAEDKIGVKAATALFRIAQEAMTNIARHANASKVTLSLRECEGAVKLMIEDDGIGITETQATGPESFGILGMKERARELGGETSVHGRSGMGTTLSVSIPLRSDGRLP